MAPDADAALMLAFQRGDERAFRALYERHAPAVIRYCKRLVGDATRAEDLAQDVFVKIYEAAPGYRAQARFKTFLYRIATNHCLNELRRPALRARAAGPGTGEDGAPDLDALPSAAATPEEHARAAALARAFEALCARLPEGQRAALLLCRLEGLSHEEIAHALETSVSAVKSLVHRATVAAAEALAPFAAAAPAREEAAR
jgi:RNA polymerase sigma-70 factor (ECF subfamily)